MRIAYDAVTWQNIPSDAAFVLGYCDGDYAWPQEAWDHFASLGIPAARIAVNPGTIADVLDCEPGNPVDPSVNPSSAVPWARSVRAAGKIPTIYCSDENVPKMMAAFRAANYIQPLYDVCDDVGKVYAWSGDDASVISTQYNITDSLDYDYVADYWPGVDPQPASADSGSTNTISTEEFTMNCASDASGHAGLSWAQGSAHVIQVLSDGATGTLGDVRAAVFYTTGPAVSNVPFDEHGRAVIEIANKANAVGVTVSTTVANAAPYYVYADGS
jgi:hypothetical protein